jgi:hypothetical protein
VRTAHPLLELAAYVAESLLLHLQSAHRLADDAQLALQCGAARAQQALLGARIKAATSGSRLAACSSGES